MQRGFETGYTPEDIQTGIALMQKASMDGAMLDVQACLAHVAGAGKAGITGYCWGGTVAWVAASRIAGLACSIPYYGGGIHANIAAQPMCPVMFQFAERDRSPTIAQAREIAAAHPQAVTHVYPADHGFNCDQRGSYDAASATLARQRSLQFLATHVG